MKKKKDKNKPKFLSFCVSLMIVGAIILFISSILLFSLSISFIYSGKNILPEEILSQLPQDNVEVLQSSLLIASVFLIVFSILIAIIARKVWRGDNKARLTAIILSLFIFLSSLDILIKGNSQSIIPAILILLSNAFIFLYLLLSKEAKSFFKVSA